MNLRCGIVVCLIVVLIALNKARAELNSYEPFDYSDIGSELIDKDGGTGFFGEWIPYEGAPILEDWKIVEGSLSFPGLKTEGNSITADLQQGDDWVGLLREFEEEASEETKYLSFLIQPEGRVGQGSFGGAFGVLIDGLGGDADILAGMTEGSTDYMIEEFFNIGTSYSDIRAESGTTSLFVIKAELTEGTDQFTLYINPSPGQAEPATGVVKRLDVGEVIGVAVAAAGTVSIDEIRWGDTFSDVTPTSLLPGDFDQDGMLTAVDIDLLSAEVRAETNSPKFDLNADRVVDQSDRDVWVVDLKRTWFGDANLDGEFNSGDLVAVFAAGEYEDDIPLNSGWATGDWDGDGDFTTSDLVTAFADGGYEQGQRPAVQAVPEPGSLAMLWSALIGCGIVARSRARRA